MEKLPNDKFYLKDKDENKEVEQGVTIGKSRFIYIKDRLAGGKVFVNEDKSTYLRTGGPSEIAGEVNLTRELYKRGFPVPKLLETGTLPNGDVYYIEQSMGEDVFGDIFREETKTSGHVSDKSFDKFAGVIRKYYEAQFNLSNFVPHDRNALARMTILETVMRNHPPSDKMREMFTMAYERASQKLLSLPWGYIQSDLNAFNVLKDGVIDFEMAGFGPVGYDILMSVYFGRMWPADRVAYVFTDEQITRYIAEVDKAAQDKNLPALSLYTDDFLILKTIWASGGDKESYSPDFLQWRVRVRDWSIKQYLTDKKIDTNQFESVGRQV
ncbi:MAG: aminoglycoside phosphotransferase family protein [Candidatus Liptonbacteria bacterium]|nr:aminoglycoside phosphotransferase family protein [Candidatus Liptonbacteria bacterium]